MGVFFSIIIPVYNGEQYIKNCLDSIYRQGLGDDDFGIWEISSKFTID